MNYATLIENPKVLPETVVEEAKPRTAGVLVMLLTQPELAAAAVALHREYGAALTAFLVGEVRFEELDPAKLKEAFLDAHLSSHRNWEQARHALIRVVAEEVEACAARDADSKVVPLELEVIGFFRDYVDRLRIVRVGEGIHVFFNRNRSRDQES
jgi:hypothetical protein